MNSLLKLIIITVLRGIGKIAYKLPPEWRTQCGKGVGIAMQWLSVERRTITRLNLQASFPDKSADWIRSIARKSFENLGITLIELLALPYITPHEARNMLNLEGAEVVEEALRRGKGALLVSGHFGNWELLGFTLPLYIDIATTLIVAPQTSKIAETYLGWYRVRTGNRTVPVHKAAPSIIRTLRAGEAIAMLPDQAAPPEHNVFVPFFGRPASTYQAPARIALRYNVPMFVAFAERLDNGSYYALIQEIVHHDLSYTPEGILALTERHTQALETAIRKRPDLWVWQHHRWKHAPPSAA